MNTHARTRNGAHLKRSFLILLLATVGLVAGFTPAANAQVAPGSLLAAQFFAAIGDEATAYQLSADAVLHTPAGDFIGRAGLARFGDALDASFADLTFTTHNAAQAGDLVIISFTLSGIHIGDYHGAISDCAQVGVPAVAVLRVAEQQVVTEQWIGYDSDAIVRQIATFNTIDPALTTGCDAYFG